MKPSHKKIEKIDQRLRIQPVNYFVMLNYLHTKNGANTVSIFVGWHLSQPSLTCDDDDDVEVTL